MGHTYCDSRRATFGSLVGWNRVPLWKVVWTLDDRAFIESVDTETYRGKIAKLAKYGDTLDLSQLTYALSLSAMSFQALILNS